MPPCTSGGPGARGGTCRPTSHPGAPRGGTSASGGTTAPSTASTTPRGTGSGSARGGSRRRAAGASTPSRSRLRGRGRRRAPTGTRRWRGGGGILPSARSACCRRWSPRRRTWATGPPHRRCSPGPRPATSPRRSRRWADAKSHNHGPSAWLTEHAHSAVEVVGREPGQKGFGPLPERWVVERTFAWLSARRRLAATADDPAGGGGGEAGPGPAQAPPPPPARRGGRARLPQGGPSRGISDRLSVLSTEL